MSYDPNIFLNYGALGVLTIVVLKIIDDIKKSNEKLANTIEELNSSIVELKTIIRYYCMNGRKKD